MALQIGKHYRGKSTGKIVRVTGHHPDGNYWGTYHKCTKQLKVVESWVEKIEYEDYDNEVGESTMKIKIGDKITLKKWEDIDHKNRRPVSEGVRVPVIVSRKQIYNQKLIIEVVSTPGNSVVGVRLPSEIEGFKYWDILEKDIYEVLGTKPKSKFRVIRTSLPQVQESKAEEKSLKEIEINLGEAFLLKIDGGEAIKVCISDSKIQKDTASPKSSKRIQLFGTIVPTETIRRIRG